MKVMVVIGTRPEAIKMAPVALELAKRGVDHVVCLTGQHRELVRQVLQRFDVEPHIDLDLMTPGQTVAGVAHRVIKAMDEVIAVSKPDWVLVQGDTTTVAAAALCAAWNEVAVGHVEAGLRSGDRKQPWPEEINRIVAGHVADRHFAPTVGARDALLREGIDPAQIVLSGNTVIDALEFQRMNDPGPNSVVARVPETSQLLLVTAHRRESFGKPLRDALGAVARLAATRPDLCVVYPVHPNPNVGAVATELLGGLDNVLLVDPVDHTEMVALLERATVALTDSGGIQEEAPALGTPVLVMREVTERPEAVAAGAARLVGTDTATIVEQVSLLLDDTNAHAAMSIGASPYGDGHASRRIVASLLGEPTDEFDCERR
ncbi:MAG: UDP-N-acetylglucosamine 2-epimerase (non-hydrolyzing) [Acidimicrobiales bacterium]|nr:UDP-N-acetylglucosamine 2-epimerase (non-hydrolyzing) [Acidimicrobiales bacterium]